MNYCFPLMNQQNKLKIFPRFQEFTHDIAKGFMSLRSYSHVQIFIVKETLIKQNFKNRTETSSNLLLQKPYRCHGRAFARCMHNLFLKNLKLGKKKLKVPLSFEHSYKMKLLFMRKGRVIFFLLTSSSYYWLLRFF